MISNITTKTVASDQRITVIAPFRCFTDPAERHYSYLGTQYVGILPHYLGLRMFYGDNGKTALQSGLVHIMTKLLGDGVWRTGVHLKGYKTGSFYKEKRSQKEPDSLPRVT